jgi:N-acetylglucosamine-6-phosphate deacetylase
VTPGLLHAVTGQLVLTDRVVPGELLIKDGRIVQVTERPEAGPSSLVLPGLVDIHVHGALGRTFNSPNPQDWKNAIASHVRHGTTSVVATLATAPGQDIASAVAVGRQLKSSRWPGLAGLHLEGPYLSEAYAGAHPPHLLTTPAGRREPGLQTVRMVTLAPELPGSGDLIRNLRAKGVTVSAGHTAVDAAGLDEAQRWGVTHAAHLWSSHTSLRKEGPRRISGLLEAVLASDTLTAEVIGDGYHVPADLLRISYRCLGPGRLCLVTDASPGTGMPRGFRFRMGGVMGEVAEGVAVSADGRYFCGSVSHLIDIVRYAVQVAAIPLPDAVRMATRTPARVSGLEDGAGTLGVGARANLVETTPDLRPLRTMVDGKWQ